MLDAREQLLKTYQEELKCLNVTNPDVEELRYAIIKIQAERDALIQYTTDLIKGIIGYETRSKNNPTSET
jgi:hypothetical protein